MLQREKCVLLIVLCCFASLFTSLAFTSLAYADDQKQWQQQLEQDLGWKVYSVMHSPIAGMYQLNTERGVFYVSEDAQYLVQGRIYNIQAGMLDETEAALQAFTLNGVKRFAHDAIQFTAKNEKFIVTVFTDLSCAYCRRMHEQMNEYNSMGITVQYLAFPRAGLASKEYDDLISVWCAQDPKNAMTTAQAGRALKASSCVNSVAEQFRFGQQIGINGTPSIILPNGSLISGYQSATELMAILQTPS